MFKKAILAVALAVMVLAILPSMAFGLVNEYGMSFAGQDKCLECHDGTYGQTVHGRFATLGLMPGAPAGWSQFRAAGNPPTIPGTAPALFNGGGSYALTGPWLTLGDYAGGSATEYLFWRGATNLATNPWNIVEGLSAEEDHGAYVVGSDPVKGLYDAQYNCQRCHMLGSTIRTANATDTAAVPNPTVSKPATYTTPPQWARAVDTTSGDFISDPTVSATGMSIQCEACHGTGFKSSTNTTKHWNSGTQLSHRIPAGTTTASGGVLPGTTVSTLLDSQVCGQCHGSFTNVAGTLGLYGFTPNLPLRTFVDINGAPSGSYAYTVIPTEAQFLAEPTKYWMFPNGSNAKGSHYYYDEWAASSHSYRGALTSSSPSALAYQKAGNGHFNAATSDLGCAKCHTGEGYLKSKNAAVTADFTPTTANVGYSGQECVTCHNAHPSGAGTPDTIRQADAVGSRSAVGLAKANASVCEDCHNWQNEVMSTAPVYKPMSDIAAHGGPSHPTRETYHGRIMAEVPAAADFMPGVKCEQCHMPETNKAANRVSHGMKIMLPGKAASWNATAGVAYAGKDSCSGCHPGETRTELQADIDKWQSEAAAQSVKAVAAVHAAQTRAEYSLTDTSKPGYLLVGKATWNYKAYTGEGSMGAHNPPYILAGLKKAVQLADSVGGSFNDIAASNSLINGNIGFVAGQALNGDGTGAAGAAVTLLNGTTSAGTTIADASGNFSFMLAPSQTTTYRVKWARSSDSIADLFSGTKTIQVTGPHTVTASASGGGVITPSGAQVVSNGGSQAFTFTPSSGYHITGVLVDSVSVGTPSSYTFQNVTADHTIAVTFAIDSFTLTYTAGSNGSITGASPQTVSPNGSGTAVTAAANTGFHFVSWSDGGTTNPRTDTNVTANKSVTANFSGNVLHAAGPSIVTAGRVFTITGTVVPAGSSVLITRYRLNSAGAWISYGRYPYAVANSSGAWSANVSASATGSWKFVASAVGKTATVWVTAK
jgi:hypothetical protein